LGVKTDVTGLMIIVFKSRECSFIMPLTEEQLKEIHQYCEGKMYVDEKAAMATGEIKKNPLAISPFIQEFEYGRSNQGYWIYQWKIQLNDCVDVLDILFGEHYEFLFCFIISVDVTKKADGLIVENIKEVWGEATKNARHRNPKHLWLLRTVSLNTVPAWLLS
jgi:hypothetical protein